MKNLDVWDVSVKDLNIKTADKFLVCYSHDESNTGEFYICSDNLVVGCFSEDGVVKWSEDLSDEATPDNSGVNITFLSLPNAIFVGLANGEMFTISSCGKDRELAGRCVTGILAMEWSPDQELLVFVTENMTAILMNCRFLAINEVNLLGEAFGEQQFINVGWGKKETQFHGSEGKQAAKVKNEVNADPHSPSDNTIKITWRGDGNLYAIGYTLEGLKRFKVFDREGHLQYTSEKQPGLEANLCWRPSGNVIATTQRLPAKYMVAFFEKNGLKHGGFDLPVNASTIVEDLAWSSDSDILTVQCKDTDSNTQKLLLFTMSNYHWYLKQTLVYTNKQSIYKVMWDNDFEVANNKKLHVVSHNGKVFTYSWIWSIDHSRGTSEDDDAVVTVIDGQKLLVTGFRQTAVPPPMAALEIEVESSINSVHFAPPTGTNTNTFFVITADGRLIIYKQTHKFPLEYEKVKSIVLERYAFPFQYYNWRWLNDDIIVSVVVLEHKEYSIKEYNVCDEEIDMINIHPLSDAVVRIEPHPTDQTTCILQDISSNMLRYTIGGLIEPCHISFPTLCPKFTAITIDDNLHCIGLSHKGNFYLDCRLVMNNVNSYYVHSHYLLLTTLQHVLLCSELTQSGLDAIKEDSENETIHVYRRKIERGARLVIAVPNDTRTVFQLPRGNIEVIQPRPLSLKIIGEYLDSLKYHEAFDLMRKQRINLNLIYDHDPDKFIQSGQVFLESIKNNSWLSLFLSDLEHVDVTKTMYSNIYAHRPAKETDASDNKVQRICEHIRNLLSDSPDVEHRILPYLTSLVKTHTVGDLESALQLIKNVKRREDAGAKLPVSSDEALKYLLYMVDVGLLYDVALGMYDFDLVLLVANKSQKDPKEYIPMLNELNEMEENYKRFSINKHLKRFDKAVKCLVDCGPEREEELKTFVKYHSLYKEALSLFPQDSEIYKQISVDFGTYLKLKKLYVEAGIVYQHGGNNDKAVECYKDALKWEMAISLAQSWPQDKFRELCRDLIEELKEEKRHKDALTILEHFLEDNEETILYAIKTAHYQTALRLCAQHNKADLKNNLLSAIQEEYNNLQDLIESNWTTFTRHRERLRVVREVKRSAPAEAYDDAEYGHRDSDLYSDAGSTVASSSRGSSRSFRSSKNRRKHERKVASLKEGSQYENVALIMALHTLVSASFELRASVGNATLALCCIGDHKRAASLQASLEKLLQVMKESFKEIWSEELVLEATNATVAARSLLEGGGPQGISTLEPHIRIAPIIQEYSWKLDGIF